MRLFSTTPLLHLLILSCLFSHVHPLCHPDESAALLELKDSFIIRQNASVDPLAYPKVASWSSKEKDDCCSWDGVECDEHNSHSLNLAHNDFNGSLIPYQLSHLPSLTYLDLSDSIFAGQIPLEISQLSNLSFLDLSQNQLELKRPDFSTFVRNLSKIKYLSLSYVDISSPVPSFLANFSSLTSLRLEHCGLYGEFPIDIFQLPNLQFLVLTKNTNLTGSFPEFHAECGFHGPLPSSLSRLSNLQLLELGRNAFSGTVDFNMFLNMKNLTIFGLSGNMLSVLIRENRTTISTNATLPKFKILSLGSCNLTTFPGFLRHQYGLTRLDLSNNSMHGKVPKWIWNTSIEILDIHDNFCTGFSIDVLPSMSLRYLDFSRNSFMGALPIPPPSTNYFDGSKNELSGEIS
ncbi:hypothetical protein TIFTF001_029545 [Ficus carica]|uniref:Leucine-rich repeat-containing N-terminal plant-type domain-containing protein n=1 Tax=Ficus carica TaxID=3494 RepID=A0AA88DRP4_FICCA|nr:hypothetical protein TIFTF001_029545 [Ficus carica]